MTFPRSTVVNGWPGKAWPRHDIMSSAGGKWTCGACGKWIRTKDQDELDGFVEEHRHGQ